MYINKKLTIVSLAALLSVGSIALAGCSSTTDSVTPTISGENYGDSESEVIVDDIGTALPIGKKLADGDDASGDSSSSETTTETLKSDMGVLLKEKDNGTYDIRFVAAFTGVNNLTAASFTRAAYTNAAGKTVESKVTKVEYVYTSVNDADQIKWIDGSALSTSYTYYMVYTVRNIPETDIFTTLSVSLSATPTTGDALAASQTANVYGIQGDITEGVTYGYNSDSTTAYAHCTDTDITTAVVAPYWADFEGFVATKKATVTELAVVSGYGAFEDCTDLVNLSLPDTITTFGRWAFDDCSSLPSMVFPRDLTSVYSYSIFSGNTWTTLYYNSTNFASSSTMFYKNLDTVYVSGNVESLPNSFVSSSYTVSKIVYEGTEAQWAALKTDSNANNGLFIDNVICSDSKIINVNYHLNGGTIDGDTDTTDDVYTVTMLSGKTITDPGYPTKTGQMFIGWYADSEFTTEYTFGVTLTVPEDQETMTVDIYAKFEDYPAGSDITTALDIAADASEASTVSLSSQVAANYFKLTAPSDGHKDYYYITVSNKMANGESSTDSIDIEIYDDDMTTELSLSTYSFSNRQTGKAFGSSSSTVNIVELDPGESIYIKAGKSSTISTGDTFTYDIAVTTREGDIESEALAYTFNDTQVLDINYTERKSQIYTFTAETTGQYVAQKAFTSGFSQASIYLYHLDDTGAVVVDADLSSSTKTRDANLTAGVTYYIWANTSNSTTTDTTYATVYVGEAPANYNPSKATVLPVDGTTETIDMANYITKYYTITPTETASYSLILEGGSTSYAKKLTVYSDATLETTVASGTESGTGSGWSSSYGGTLDVLTELTAGQTYYVAVGFNTTSTVSSSTSFTFQMVKREAGDLRGTAIALTMSGDTNLIDTTEIVGFTSGKWYTFTTKAAGYITLAVNGLDADNSASIKVYSGTSTSTSDSGTDVITFYVSSSKQYYVNIVTTTDVASGLTLTSAIENTTAIGDLGDMTMETSVTKELPLASIGRNVYTLTTGDVTDVNTVVTFSVSSGTASFTAGLYSATYTEVSGSIVLGTDSDTASFKDELKDNDALYLILDNVVLSDASATISVTFSYEVIPPDGSTAAKALTFEGDENGEMTFTSYNSSGLWYKYTPSTTGTYRVYSNSSSKDPYLRGIYTSAVSSYSSTACISGTYFNDCSTFGSIYYNGDEDTKAEIEALVSRTGYDFYVEVEMTADSTYWMNVSGMDSGTKMSIVLKA